ncbi:MAG: membrane protease YdiL (CAAX protease family) [Phenylobacterium sp.]|jgi:membrane protease YdiL (CAAX protease family)
MITLNYILWGYFIVYPIYIYLTHEQEKQSVIAQPEKLIGVYRVTMFHLWWPTLILLVLVYHGQIAMSEIGLQWQWDLANQIGVAGLVLLVGYLLLSLKQLAENSEEHQKVRDQMACVRWLMPTTIKESRYFIWGVSLTAGICEELLFRGYLMQQLAPYMPMYAVVIVSSLAFGLPHIYQGPMHVVRTTIIGLVMALIYLATDSLVIVMILHALLDMYGGVVAYMVLSKQSDPNHLISGNKGI